MVAFTAVALVRGQKALDKLTDINDEQIVHVKVRESKGSHGYNAASVAGLLLTTEAMVAEAPKEEHDHPAPGGGMGGMGGMDM